MQLKTASSITIIFIALLTYTIPQSTHTTPQTQIFQETTSEKLWLDYATAAWHYFQPGIGVSPNTGLNYATIDYHYFTDWDLGCYISAIIDAERIGLLKREGTWGADYRINKIISFLMTRKLTEYGLPYWFYSSDTGEPVVSKGQGNPSDSGRLLIALYMLKQYRPEFTDEINKIIARTNYAKFAEAVSTDGFYAYYLAHGYSLFGFNTSQVQKALSFIDRIPNMEHVQVYSQSLPITEIIMEPILHTIFELETNQKFQDWAYKVYKVQEDRYTNTGKLTAFTEGAYDTSPNYIYEWIVHPYGKVWYITTPTWQPMNIPPVVYTKTAFSMYAIWPSNYTKKLIDYVLRTKTDNGFYEGVDENGRVIQILTDKTNSLIINAARYALDIKIKPELSLNLSQTSLTLHTNEAINVTVNVLSPLPVNATLSISGIPNGITATFNPQSGITNYTSTLTLTTNSSAKEGTYILNITAQSPDATQASATLNLTIKIKGYTLRIRVMDWDMENPIANATVHLNQEIKTSNAEGYAEWNNLTGTVTVRISYLGIWVSNTTNIEMNMNKTVEIQCKFYDVYIRVLTSSGKPISNITLIFSLNEKTLSSAITNQTGYAYFQDLPASNLTLTAYAGSNRTVKLGEWTIEVYEDNQIIDPTIGENNIETRIQLTHLTTIIIIPFIIALITLIKLKLKKHNEIQHKQT